MLPAHSETLPGPSQSPLRVSTGRRLHSLDRRSSVGKWRMRCVLTLLTVTLRTSLDVPTEHQSRTTPRSNRTQTSATAQVHPASPEYSVLLLQTCRFTCKEEGSLLGEATRSLGRKGRHTVLSKSQTELSRGMSQHKRQVATPPSGWAAYGEGSRASAMDQPWKQLHLLGSIT